VRSLIRRYSMPWWGLKFYILISLINPHALNSSSHAVPSHNFFFFWIRENPTSRKAHFVRPGEEVKSRLFQTLTRDACPDSNSRPAVHISSPLPSRYASWDNSHNSCLTKLYIHEHIYHMLHVATNWKC
jgi:hypothetical protein